MPANAGTVGLLKAVLTADTTQFDAGMKKAATTTQQVEKGVTGLEKAVARLTPQADRMVKALGGDKILYQANNLTAAITKLGGAQKLTEAEQVKVNRTLTEAIAKYKQLGVEAPEAMLKVAASTSKITPPTSLASKATSELKTSFSSLLGAFALSNLITNGVTSLVSLGKEAVASGARLVDLRDRTGLTLATLQRMEFVATQSGDSLDDLTAAAFKLSRMLAGGTSSVREAVRDLGLDFVKLQAMTPDQQWEAVAAALSKVTNAGERARLGVALVGKSFESVAGSIKANYKLVADQAVLASDAQLEALDKAGDAWEAFKNRQTTYVRAILGATVSAVGELQKMKFSDIAMTVLAAGMGPNAMGDTLAMLSARAGKEGPKPFIGPPQNTKPPLPPNYTAMLREAQKAVDGLTASQREQLAAAQKMSASEDDQLALLDRFGIKVDDAKGVLMLFSAATKDAAHSLSAEFHAAMTKLNEDLGRSKGLSDAAFTKEFGSRLEDMSREMEKFGVKGAAVPKNIGNGFSRLLNIELAKFNAEMAAIPDRLEAIGREAAAALNDVEAAAGQSSIRLVADQRESAKLSRSIEFGRASAAIESAKRWGASWQQVYAMESQLSRQRMIAEVGDSQTAFEERVRALRLTTDISQSEYDSMREIEKKTQEQIVEDWQLAEKAKRDELTITHDVWIRLYLSVRDMGKQIQADFSYGLADMLVGLRGFKEGWLSIWHSIQQSFSNVLGQMLNDFIGGFIRKIVGAATGMGSMFGGGGGVGGGLLGSAASIGGSALLGGAGGLLAGGGLSAAASVGTFGDIYAGLGGGAAAGGGAAGGGLGATIGGLATNPFTIAAAGGLALGLLIWKKGLFRGGEEGTKVNPARDKFFAQFGGLSGLQGKLTTALIKQGQPDAGNKADALIRAVLGAHTMKSFQSAEHGVAHAMGPFGRGVKFFNMGGFVPPNITQPAMLHGGSMGEMVVPLQKLAQMAGGHDVHNHYYTIQGWDGADIDRVFRQEIIPRQKRALQLNQEDLRGHTKRVLK